MIGRSRSCIQGHTVGPTSYWLASILFHSSNSRGIPKIELFQNLTSKIQAQGHGWGQSSWSHRSLSIHLMNFFMSSKSAQPFLRYDQQNVCKKQDKILKNKANLRDLRAVTSLTILLKLDLIIWFFSLCDLQIWWITLENNRAPLIYYIKLCVSFQISRSKLAIFVLCDLEIWGMTFKINRAPLLYSEAFCIISKSLVNSNSSYSPETLNLGQNRRFFLLCLTMKFDRWPWKSIRHLFYSTSSFVHNVIAISETKLELQSGNTQFVSKSMILCPVWPWNLTDDIEKQ